LDHQVQHTLDYYSKLFQPVFAQGNVLLLRTRFDADAYDLAVEEDCLVTKRTQLLTDTSHRHLYRSCSQHLQSYSDLPRWSVLNRGSWAVARRPTRGGQKLQTYIYIYESEKKELYNKITDFLVDVDATCKGLTRNGEQG
jgi:hypothetical protein